MDINAAVGANGQGAAGEGQTDQFYEEDRWKSINSNNSVFRYDLKLISTIRKVRLYNYFGFCRLL
jgi:hypothetical protein